MPPGPRIDAGKNLWPRPLPRGSMIGFERIKTFELQIAGKTTQDRLTGSITIPRGIRRIAVIRSSRNLPSGMP